jgi:Tol biopolymer transport system component
MSNRPILAAILMSMVVGGAGTAARPEHGIPGSVAFFSARTGNNEIYVMDPDGSNPERITANAASDTDPAISPDGRDILFTSNRTGDNDIYIVDSRGGDPVDLTNNPANDGWARWAPDGQHVVFHSNRDDLNFELYVMDRDGSNVVRITNHVGVDQYPEWSPDGQKIAFRRNTDIAVLDLNTGMTERLTNAAPLNQMPTWSPNGRQIAFMSTRDGYPSIFLMNADGTNQVNLTPRGPSDLDAEWNSRAPSWSRNGRQIYFTTFRPATNGDTEIFVMNADGSAPTNMTNSSGMDADAHVR